MRQESVCGSAKSGMLTGCIIVIAAFWIRMHNLALLPINHDEAKWVCGVLQYQELIKPSSFFSAIFHPARLHLHFIYYLFGIVKTDTLNSFISLLRLQSVLAGTGTVAMVYSLARRMYDRGTAVTSALLLCFLAWHIIHSRIMERVIWVPFAGCLIFFGLFNALQAKSKIRTLSWFLFSLCILGKSLLGYESSILFIPIFIVSFIFLIKEVKSFPAAKIIFPALILVVLFSAPFFLTTLKCYGKSLRQNFFRDYQVNLFSGNMLMNIWDNLKANLFVSLKELFFASRTPSFLYGQALRWPLFVHPILGFLSFLSLIFAFLKRKPSDKLLLSWLFLGFSGAIAGINFFQERYILIIIPPLVILTGRFIAELCVRRDTHGIRKIRFLVASAFFIGMVLLEISQYLDYYYRAPFDLSECQANSYGSKQAAEYLASLPEMMNSEIVMERKMTVYAYLAAFRAEDGSRPFLRNCGIRGRLAHKGCKSKFYVCWAQVSYPIGQLPEAWSLYAYIQKKLPGAPALKTIYYPHGIPAIYIFKEDCGK